MADTVFHKIMRGELPAKYEYEDDRCMVIHTIAPRAPVHVLVIPKQDMEHLGFASDQDVPLLGHLLIVARQVAEKLGIADGFKISINNGKKAGQEVAQLHLHVLGGWQKQIDDLTAHEF